MSSKRNTKLNNEEASKKCPDPIKLSDDELHDVIRQYQTASKKLSAFPQPLDMKDCSSEKERRELKDAKDTLGKTLVAAMSNWFQAREEDTPKKFPPPVILPPDVLRDVICQYQTVSEKFAAFSQPLDAKDSRSEKERRELKDAKEALGKILIAAMINWFRDLVGEITKIHNDDTAEPYLQAAIAMFFEKLPKFDREKGNIFGYMYSYLFRAVFDEHAKARKYLPFQAENYKKIREAEVALKLATGRTPTDNELAQFMGLTVEELVKRRYPVKESSLNVPVRNDEGEERPLDLADENTDVEKAVLSTVQEDRFEALVDELPLREKYILTTMRNCCLSDPASYSRDAALQEAADALHMSKSESEACLRQGLLVLKNLLSNT